MCANSDLSCLQWHILSPSTFRACNLFFCLDSIVWFIPQFDFISDLIALSLAPALLFCYFFSHLFTIWPFLDLIQKTYIALAIAILLFLVFFPSLSPTLQFTQRRDVWEVRLTRLTLTSMRRFWPNAVLKNNGKLFRDRSCKIWGTVRSCTILESDTSRTALCIFILTSAYNIL